MLAAWPRGSFDSTVDLVNDPSSIPSSFTRGGHPYGWTGFAALGPFNGLSALNNNVHALNSDETAQADAAPILFKLDPEVYLATLLQRAPRSAFRHRSGEMASERLTKADPTPDIPGLNSYAVLPTYPRPNYVTTNSLLASKPGQPTGYAIHAMSAFQNALSPPVSALAPSIATRGREIFERAGCVVCHAGPALTNNRVLPAAAIGTEPTRARALSSLKPYMAKPVWYGLETPFPPPSSRRAAVLAVTDPSQLILAWAHDPKGEGGYKTPSLIGLAWTAPYLHDGGVAASGGSQLGLPGTLRRGRVPDPALSLKALLTQALRAKVVAANRADPQSVATHVTGDGHSFWVDGPRGFSAADQQALVAYLLGRPGSALHDHGPPSSPRPVSHR